MIPVRKRYMCKNILNNLITQLTYIYDTIYKHHNPKTKHYYQQATNININNKSQTRLQNEYLSCTWRHCSTLFRTEFVASRIKFAKFISYALLKHLSQINGNIIYFCFNRSCSIQTLIVNMLYQLIMFSYIKYIKTWFPSLFKLIL